MGHSGPGDVICHLLVQRSRTWAGPAGTILQNWLARGTQASHHGRCRSQEVLEISNFGHIHCNCDSGTGCQLCLLHNCFSTPAKVGCWHSEEEAKLRQHEFLLPSKVPLVPQHVPSYMEFQEYDSSFIASAQKGVGLGRGLLSTHNFLLVCYCVLWGW